MIKSEIKKQRMNALRSGDKFRKSILTTLLGAIETEEKRGKTMNDTDVVSLLKKWVANSEENHKLTSDETFQKEKSIYLEFLPKQMSDEELSREIDYIINDLDNINIGSVMSNLKLRHGGTYDGKKASQMIKDKLS